LNCNDLDEKRRVKRMCAIEKPEEEGTEQKEQLVREA
jgi:hypothetical protein